jgi:hydrogenase/urease accessory protein HupE
VSASGLRARLGEIVLLFGALFALRRRPQAWSVALAANAFAIVGFAVGLTRTTQEGGGAVDIGYHATVLPLLLLTLVSCSAGDSRLEVGSSRRSLGAHQTMRARRYV